MSDIKYIIVGEDGEHTRFPCLAIVRYAMAAAVTMLAISVVALVIHAMLRSEDIRLSVNNGFIGADNLWFDVSDQSPKSSGQVTVVGQQVETAKQLSGHAPMIPVTIGGPSSDKESNDAVVSDDKGLVAANVGSSGDDDKGLVAANVGSSGDDTGEATETTTTTTTVAGTTTVTVNVGSSFEHHAATTRPQVTLHKVNNTNLHVILIANNPSGRTKIDCNDTTVRLIDMRPPKGVIGSLKLANFTVPPQTTITLQGRMKNTNTSYIWWRYGWDARFSVMVQVNASVTSYPMGKIRTNVQTYECQPVIVGLMDDEAIFATGQVDCRGNSVKDSADGAGTASAPAPAPASSN